jgi:hypothetical protein
MQRKSPLVLLGKLEWGTERKHRQLTRKSGIKIGCQCLDYLVALATEHRGVVKIGVHRP